MTYECCISIQTRLLLSRNLSPVSRNLPVRRLRDGRKEGGPIVVRLYVNSAYLKSDHGIHAIDRRVQS